METHFCFNYLKIHIKNENFLTWILKEVSYIFQNNYFLFLIFSKNLNSVSYSFFLSDILHICCINTFFFCFSGIRLENLVNIVEASTPHNFRSRGYLTFNDLTVVPIQQKMIVPSLLTQDEINYINNYHQRCRDMVGPLLRSMGKKDGLNWLIKETSPIG